MKRRERKPKYGMRKLSIGLVSCMLFSTMFLAGNSMIQNPIAHAEEVTDTIKVNLNYNLEETTDDDYVLSEEVTLKIGDPIPVKDEIVVNGKKYRRKSALYEKVAEKRLDGKTIWTIVEPTGEVVTSEEPKE